MVDSVLDQTLQIETSCDRGVPNAIAMAYTAIILTVGESHTANCNCTWNQAIIIYDIVFVIVVSLAIKNATTNGFFQFFSVSLLPLPLWFKPIPGRLSNDSLLAKDIEVHSNMKSFDGALICGFG